MTQETGAPTDVEGPPALDDRERATFAAVADHLIPAVADMPSAADVVTDEPARVRAPRPARPGQAAQGRAASRPRRGRRAASRAARRGAVNLAALQLAIVGGYYTDRRVRELIGYPGQMAIELRSWEYPAYLDEGLIDAVLARGPVWRDPSTGQRAVVRDAPRTYAERFSADGATPEGGQ